MTSNTLLRFRTTLGNAIFVEKVSFKDGDGWKVKKIFFTKDRSKAARFQPMAADAIAKQYFTNPVCTELVDGTLVKDYTPEHMKKSEDYYRVMRANADAVNQLFHDAILSVGKDLIDALAKASR